MAEPFCVNRTEWIGCSELQQQCCRKGGGQHHLNTLHFTSIHKGLSGNGYHKDSYVYGTIEVEGRGRANGGQSSVLVRLVSLISPSGCIGSVLMERSE